MSEASELWTGAAGSYHQARPAPPAALLDLLMQVLGMPRPALVVDLGSGTGLSSAIWSERADRVIGIEPNAGMRGEAERAARGLGTTGLEYRAGTAQQTGLPDRCADIVTAAQSFHWMEPAATLAEVARILRPGGLFAAYDYDSPPTIRWELDQEALAVNAQLVALVRERGLSHRVQIWPKDRHLERMRESGHFRFTREVVLHHIEHGDATRYLAMTRSNALSQQFAFTDQELGLDRLSSAAARYLGAASLPWYVSYRVRIGVI